MKLVKIKVTSEYLKKIGFVDFFEEIDSVEIMQIFQYDQKNFFSMQKIILKSDDAELLETVLKKKFDIISFQLLEKKRKEILCILKQRNTAGFWPLLISGSWAILPPIYINAQNIIFSLLFKENEQYSQLLGQFYGSKSFEILALTNADEKVQPKEQLFPRLTTRQREIMTYASTHGYYDIPRKISVYNLADYFHISPAGVNNHIQKAEKAIMKFHFG